MKFNFFIPKCYFTCVKFISFFRLHDVLDEIEEDNRQPIQITLHPPENGDVSDAESGDEETCNANHLPRSMLLARAEINEINEENDEIVEPIPKKFKEVVWKKRTSTVISVSKRR